MFRNRKRRPNDDDDPLVPHGLIWYATDAEPEARDAESTEPQKTADVVEINHSRVAEQRPPEESRPETKPPAPAVPKHAHSAEHVVPEPIKATRDLPAQSNVVPIAPPSQPVIERSPNLQVVRVAEIIEIEPCAPQESKAARIFAIGLASLHTSSTYVRHGVYSLGTTVRQTWTRTSSSIEFEKRALHAKELGRRCGQNLAALASDCYGKAQTRLAKLQEEALRQSKRASGNLRSAFSDNTNRISTYLSTHHLATRRMRIVLAGLPLRLRILFARRMSEWKMVESAPGDARLRTSMTLAGITAIIALLIVSLVPRYAAKSLPSRMLSSPATVNASTASPAADITVPVAKSVPKTVSEKTIRKPVQKPVVAHAKPTRRKVYQASEDEYIAPDTYRYYGNKSAVSR